jgi:hypothetical protein
MVWDTGQAMVVLRVDMISGPQFAYCVGRLVCIVATDSLYISYRNL